jgi:peptidyl-prolyl cis-trans isomerase D
MLKLMRDSFHHLKWILLAIVAAFIIGFVYVDMGLGGATRNPQQDVRAYAARVNGETISFREYERALYYTTRNYEQVYQKPLSAEMIQQMGLPKQVLDSLVDQHLLLQQAQRLHLTATEDEVRAKILQIPVLNTGGKFVGEEMYARYVTGSLGYTSPAEFENELNREITLSKMESALSNSLIISPKAAEAEYRRATENAKIKYAMLPISRVAATVTVTAPEVDQYYAQNQAKYTHTEQREIKYLVADLGSIKSQIKPSDAELKQRYDSTKEDYKHPSQAHILHILIKVDTTATPEVDAAAKAKAEGLVKQLRAGADFATLARANSQDPSSAGNGGDMGFVDQGQTVQAFDTAAFSAPLNTVLDPIRTADFGYHIIKILERREAGYRSFEEVKPRLTAVMINDLSMNRARDAITAIAARMREKKPKSVEEFTANANVASGVSSNDSQWFSKSDAPAGLGNNPAIGAWAFQANLGDISDVIGTQRGPAIAYLYNIRKAGITAESEIRAKVESDARDAKAREVAKSEMAKALPAANIDELAKKLNVPALETTVQRAGFVSGFRGDTSPLVDAAMAANAGELKGPIALNDGAVAFQVTAQKKVDAKEAEENRVSYSEMLRQQEARSLRTVLLQRLRKSATVDINQNLLQQQQPQQQAGL